MTLIHRNNGHRVRKIAIANQKGGTAKTTTAINLTAGLARLGRRVLLVDMDPQANATSVFLTAEFILNPAMNLATTYEVMVHGADASAAIQEVELESNTHFPDPASFYLLPSHVRLAKAGVELPNIQYREHLLTNALKPIEHQFDYIILDCPPALGLLTINALMAAREIMIPVEPGFFSIIGIGLLQQTIRDITSLNRGLQLLGVLPTLQDNTVESRDTVETLEEMFKKNLLPGIPRRVAVKEAHSSGMDIFAYEARNDAAVAYATLVKEVEKRG